MEKNSDEITILDFWNLFVKNFKYILLMSFSFCLVGALFAWVLIVPKYISSADVMIQVEQSSSGSNDSEFDLVNAFRLIDTVAELMVKDIILSNTIEKLENLGYETFDVDYIRNGLIIKSSSTSYFIDISFSDHNPQLSRDVVDSVIDAVIEETVVENAFPVLTDKIRRTSFSNEATYHTPNRILFLFLGFTFGFIFSLGHVIIKESFSQNFKNKDEIEDVLGLNVIGVIPKMNIKEIKNEKKSKTT